MAAFSSKPDYGVDAPYVMRNLFLCGTLALLIVVLTPPVWHLGQNEFRLHGAFAWMGCVLVGEGFLFLLYVRWGKFRHRDRILRLAAMRGDERVLDVGCGRGLLLAGAAKRLTSGQGVGLDLWSNTDMRGNSAAATLHNLKLEGIAECCTLVDGAAQSMPFDSDSFDLVVSNLCLHNIEDKTTRQAAVEEIARVTKPGGLAILSDFKHVGEYAAVLKKQGWTTEVKWGNPISTFPPLRMVVARRPLENVTGETA